MNMVIKPNRLDIAASAKRHADGTVTVKRGSGAYPKLSASISEAYRKLFAQLKAEGVLVKGASGNLRFTRDHTFRSASAAASIVLARQANGRTEWQTMKGDPIADVVDFSEADRSRAAQRKAPNREGRLNAYARQVIADATAAAVKAALAKVQSA